MGFLAGKGFYIIGVNSNKRIEARMATRIGLEGAVRR